jgi:two-component system sensor histidine kinase KdpD
VKFYNTRKLSILSQSIVSVSIVFLCSMICFLSRSILEYKTVSLILLMSVSILAMLFDIVPVLIASILSALIWNFLFIPPVFTFHISNTNDVLLFFLYFLIALINAVLTFQIRKEEKKTRDKEEKENTIKLYNTLLNSLSHELRTPISTIISSIDSLKDENIKEENKQLIINEMDVASIRLNRQVDNLLNMSRLDSGMLHLNIDWVDMEDLIHSTLIKLKNSFNTHTIENQIETNFPLCKLDAGLMEYVIYNLILNAILYTPEGSKIKVVITNENQFLNLKIEDNGWGIKTEYIDKIFEKFYRISHSKTGGVGLGLSIVKGFVEAHKGTIVAKNIAPHGSQFKIQIPVEFSYINNLKNE